MFEQEQYKIIGLNLNNNELLRLGEGIFKVKLKFIVTDVIGCVPSVSNKHD